MDLKERSIGLQMVADLLPTCIPNSEARRAVLDQVIEARGQDYVIEYLRLGAALSILEIDRIVANA